MASSYYTCDIFFQPTVDSRRKNTTLSSSRLSNGFDQLSQDLSVIHYVEKKHKKRKKVSTRKHTSWERKDVTTPVLTPMRGAISYTISDFPYFFNGVTPYTLFFGDNGNAALCHTSIFMETRIFDEI